MDENKNDTLSRIDELLESTSYEKRYGKVAKEEVTTTPDDFKSELSDFPTESDEFEDISSKEIHTEPEDVPEYIQEDMPEYIQGDVPEYTQEIVLEDMPEDIQEDVPEYTQEIVLEDMQEDTQDDMQDDDDTQINDSDYGQVRVIDETSTAVVIEVGPDISSDELDMGAEVKTKKPKEKVKLNALQITIIAIVSVIVLWLIIFTVDHTLSAQGLSPLFSFKSEEYEDGSQSFVGAGYKIQFQFDANGNLTQKCVPAWKDGPNDIKYSNTAE